MRRVGLVLLALSSSVVAAPSAPASPPLTWAEWVGDWTGKLRWSSCSADGNDKATVSVDAVDGAVGVDLAGAGGALTAMSLVPDGAQWTAQQGDVTVRLEYIRHNRLELAVDLDSGCEIRGTLSRGGTGLAACDRLAAWARIEAQCTKLSRPPLENPARVARQREQWLAAKGPARGKLAAQCTARATKVETALIDAGCAPDRDPQVGLRGAECQALRTAASRLGRCGNVPTDVRALLEREVVVLVAASQGADKAALPVVEGECRKVRDRIVAIGKQAGCPI